MSQVGTHELKPIGQSQIGQVCLGDIQRSQRDVRSQDTAGGQLECHGARDATRAGTEIEDCGPPRQRQLECRLDQVLGFGTRNQDAGINPKGAAIELLVPDDIGDRFAGQSAAESELETSVLAFGQGTILSRQDLCLGPARDVCQQTGLASRVEG